MVRVLFLHPDLGIGGAERLVVDAALALRSKNHDVHIVTCHHDKGHCFEETRDGSLDVTAVGDWLPRSLFGRCAALCAYIRMIYAAIYIVYSFHFKSDVVFCDQISACIPFLRWLSGSPKIVFYCHFPDQLLTHRHTWIKALYRKPIDWLEEKTTGMADVVLVNSRFTAGVFHDTFRSLSVVPDVLYPSLNVSQFDKNVDEDEQSTVPVQKNKFTFLSINRYERKKNLPLAIKAFSVLKNELGSSASLQLIMAGGYDSRVAENLQHFDELAKLASDQLGLKVDQDVLFLKSPSDSQKLKLLKSCHALLYTPSGEHFGIVPIESMYCGLPVVAVNDGGPTETVVDGLTGFLCQPTPEDFAKAMKKLYEGGSSLKSKLGSCGKDRVLKNFAYSVFAEKLDVIVMTRTLEYNE